MIDFARKPTKEPTNCSILIHLLNLFSASYQHESMSSAESPPSKNLDQKWSGFFYMKCRYKACQLCNSGVLQLNGFGWLNVLMSKGNDGGSKMLKVNNILDLYVLLIVADI